jgi:hypothetical protein
MAQPRPPMAMMTAVTVSYSALAGCVHSVGSCARLRTAAHVDTCCCELGGGTAAGVLQVPPSFLPGSGNPASITGVAAGTGVASIVGAKHGNVAYSGALSAVGVTAAARLVSCKVGRPRGLLTAGGAQMRGWTGQSVRWLPGRVGLGASGLSSLRAATGALAPLGGRPCPCPCSIMLWVWLC